jgi:beta-glucosidase
MNFNHKMMGSLLLPLLLSQTVLFTARAQEIPSYQDTRLSFAERARDLVRRMSLEEKVSQLGHTSDVIERLGIPQYD